MIPDCGRVTSARPLFITGAGRSGTSMTAGVLSTLGLEFGPTLGPSKYNRKGFYENLSVRNGVLKPFIKAAGGDPEGQRYWPAPGRGNPADLRKATLQALRGANAYKDAKICLIHEVWRQAVPDSLYVFVRRDPLEIAKSCMRTSFMAAFDTKEAWCRWAEHYLACVDAMKPHVEHIEVWPDGTADVFEPVAEFCGLEWDRKAVQEFVDPSLWHTR